MYVPISNRLNDNNLVMTHSFIYCRWYCLQ